LWVGMGPAPDGQGDKMESNVIRNGNWALVIRGLVAEEATARYYTARTAEALRLFGCTAKALLTNEENALLVDVMMTFRTEADADTFYKLELLAERADRVAARHAEMTKGLTEQERAAAGPMPLPVHGHGPAPDADCAECNAAAEEAATFEPAWSGALHVSVPVVESLALALGWPAENVDVQDTGGTVLVSLTRPGAAGWEKRIHLIVGQGLTYRDAYMDTLKNGPIAMKHWGVGR